MNSVVINLIQNFLIGGTLVALTSYVGTFFSPLVGAIFWSFPISILPTLYFMKQNNKSNEYISKFTLSTTYALALLVVTTFFLSYFIKQERKGITKAVLKTTIVWLASSILFYILVKYFDLENFPTFYHYSLIQNDQF